jgi:hypothetical protein
LVGVLVYPAALDVQPVRELGRRQKLSSHEGDLARALASVVSAAASNLTLPLTPSL